MSSIDVAIDYHQQTKHHFHRLAASLGYMDWATQPDPYRRFEGATLFQLPFPRHDQTAPYERIYQPRAIAPWPLTLESISSFFFYSLSLSAQKAFGGSSWTLRVNPSSGNLHPTEGYLAICGIEGINDDPAVYHYRPDRHALERRTVFTHPAWDAITFRFPPRSFLVGLSSIHWRESWKYGERAWRYCQHDCGHALAALRLSAALHGWNLRMLTRVSDDDIAALLGLDRGGDFRDHEREAPDLLAAVYPNTARDLPNDTTIVHEHIRAVADGKWRGVAAPLSKEHQPWEIIDAVHRACYRTTPDVAPTDKESPPLPDRPFVVLEGEDPPETEDGKIEGVEGYVGKSSYFPIKPCGHSAGRTIRQRRSALGFDAHTALSRRRFYAMLCRVVPALSPIPWDALPRADYVHLGIFVHRVKGLPPGLYLLARNADKVDALKDAMNGDFEWQKPEESPEPLPLYRLRTGDARRTAMQISCTQDIASDGCFSFGMLAEFDEPLRRNGAWFYRRLFWETGVIGQVLYLEAEALGLRATGIGCFFDDPMHEICGLRDTRYQSLYHFTLGGHVPDPRLTDLPVYKKRA